ncbi:MAG: carbohydrate-binding family 9-like protein [Kiritimatiellae bacterium]|nr:carbohydrate-binding family 9-like protein [Kiritimatiellia bacterium]
MQQANLISCPRVLPDLRDDWQQVQTVFASVPSVPLQQAWRVEPEAEFRPAHVACGWDDQALWVYAVLEDDDILNPVRENHQPAFLRGDVFEIFLRPEGDTTYYELHVTPHNHFFQLRIPSKKAFYQHRQSGLPSEWTVLYPLFSSRVELQPEKRRWRILARIEFAKLGSKTPPQPGSDWQVSFSRYDYSQNRVSPILSSSSNHTKVDFHRQEEWNILMFT